MANTENSGMDNDMQMKLYELLLKKQEEAAFKSDERIEKHKERLNEAYSVKALQQASNDAIAKYKKELDAYNRFIENQKKKGRSLDTKEAQEKAKRLEEIYNKSIQATNEVAEAERKSADALALYKTNLYKKLSLGEKQRWLEFEREARKGIVEDLESQAIQASIEGDHKKWEQIKSEIDRVNGEISSYNNRIDKLDEARKKAERHEARRGGGLLSGLDTRVEQKDAEARKKTQEAQEKWSEYYAAKQDGASEEQLKQLKKNAKQADKAASKAERQRDALKDISKATQLATEAMGKAIDKSVQDMNRWYTSINTRLSGTGKTFNDINDLVRKNLATNPFVKMTSVLDSINQLTQKGIVYDLETRGYLLAMKDEVVATFDATNGTLLRLIRLQQADTTAARMGMQVELTKFLNKMYADSSYLAENIAQSISDAMVEATSQMTNQQGLEFEWVVQKWLGSLVSLGLSSNAAQSIAQGLNWLSTGNVQQLTGNDQLNTLLAMSSAKGGQSYADILTRGLNAETTNELLKAMVVYLREIASNENQVVKSAYGNIFNMSVADLRAISNMTEADIKQIYSQRKEMTMASAENYLFDQLSTVGDRVHLSQKIDNVIDNILYTVGSNIADTSWTYGLYRLNRVIEQVGNKGLSIPFISAFGTGFDLNASIQQVIDFGLLGFGLVSSIGDIFGSLGNNGTITADKFQQMWNPKAFNTRGQNFAGLAGGLRPGLSQSTVVGNASSADMKESTLSEQAESAKETQAITGIGEEQDHEFDDLWNEDDPMCVRIVSSEDNPLRVENVDFNMKALIKLRSLLPKLFRSNMGDLTNPAASIGDDGEEDLLSTLFSEGVKVKVTNEIDEPVPVSFGMGIGEMFYPM